MIEAPIGSTPRGHRIVDPRLAPAAFTALLILFASLVATPTRARERLVRVYDERDGLAVAEIADLAQDARGFIWIGTMGGLVRLDGHELRPWASDTIRHVVEVLSTEPGGGVLVGARSEPLYRVTHSGVEPICGPDGKPIRGWLHAALGRDGSLWVIRKGGLSRRMPSGAWIQLDAAQFDGSALTRVLPASRASIHIATEEALWRVDSASDDTTAEPIPRLVASVGRIRHLGLLPDSSLIALSRDGRLFRIADGKVRLLLSGTAHGRGLAIRDEVIWASIDQYVYALRPGREPEIVAPAPGLPTGRPLLVDREGSLWIGGYRGVLVMPEPETVIWNDLDGLPSPAHCRFVTKSQETVWVSTWYGSGRIDLRGPRPRAAIDSPRHSGRFCPDGRGGLWFARGDSVLVCRTRTRHRTWHFPGLHGIYASARRADGSLWLATDDGIFVSGPGAPRAIRCATPRFDDDDSADGSPTGDRGAGDSRGESGSGADWPRGWRDSWLSAILEDSGGTLWIGGFEWIARAPAREVLSAAGADLPLADPDLGGIDPPREAPTVARATPAVDSRRSSLWKVASLPGANAVNAIVQMPSGAIWAATGNGGVRRWTGAGWEELGGSRRLPSPRIYGMVASSAGGVWVLAAGSLVRVLERPDSADGWEIVERLTSWQGLPNQQASDLLEEPDGRLWLATLAGLVEVAPEARRADPHPPALELIALGVDGVHLPPDRPPSLPYRRNRLEIRFAALSFRDRSLIRYRARTDPGGPWFESHEPSLHFVDLAPGRHMAEISASLDGRSWSERPARVDFLVRRPWYAQAWAIASFAFAAAALLVTIHRVRLAVLLRLERQRMGIAMDLHDEMGSGLGSIGILAGIAADEGLAEESRRSLAERIGRTASELGAALTDIVWSLRRESETLESLAARLAERGSRLAPEFHALPGPDADSARPSASRGRIEFDTDFPASWPHLRLPLEVRRNLQLIAVEAMHNAARHAAARRVVLGLRPDGQRWCLWVADDGIGIASGWRAATTAGGHGLANMRCRAEQIGADLSIGAHREGGTTVSVWFDPRGRSRSRARNPHDHASSPLWRRER